MGETVRAAARVVCVDGDGRLLLLHWRDPVSGRTLWEPPGGGIEAGESPLEAARRELTEETGLPGAAVAGHQVIVRRRIDWLGRRYVRDEPFFLARFARGTAATPQAFTAEEKETYLGQAWLTPAEIAGLPDDLEPPDLLQVLANLLSETPPVEDISYRDT